MTPGTSRYYCMNMDRIREGEGRARTKGDKTPALSKVGYLSCALGLDPPVRIIA